MARPVGRGFNTVKGKRGNSQWHMKKGSENEKNATRLETMGVDFAGH